MLKVRLLIPAQRRCRFYNLLCIFQDFAMKTDLSLSPTCDPLKEATFLLAAVPSCVTNCW